jgi:hypothetical protein
VFAAILTFVKRRKDSDDTAAERAEPRESIPPQTRRRPPWKSWCYGDSFLISKAGEKNNQRKKNTPDFKARGWVVEVCSSWLVLLLLSARQMLFRDKF